MDWFERITGFREGDYDSTQARLSVEGGQLVSQVNGSRHGVGRLELVSLHSLQQRCAQRPPSTRRTTVRSVVGDARALHLEPSCAGALFQVASQFNLLEMVSPQVTPEDGVSGYAFDRTQGPACAMAAGAATVFRNYLAPVDGLRGQTATRQIDALRAMGDAMATRLSCNPGDLWTMRNGYALCTPQGLVAMGQLLSRVDAREMDELRGQLCIGLHHDVEVTDAPHRPGPTVTQAFCSALPVAYTDIAATRWEPFARLVLDAAYEATLLAASLRLAEGGSPKVLLTRLGGGAFGNDDHWIDDAMARALAVVEMQGLDVQLVSHGRAHASHLALQRQWPGGAG